MTGGCFCYIVADLKLLGQYFKEDYKDFELTNNLFLRLNLDHERNEFNLLKLKDLIILTYSHEVSTKAHRKPPKFILGILLTENEDPEKFRPALKSASNEIEALDLLNISREEFETKLKQIYEDHIETLMDILHPREIKERVISRTKNLLEGSKQERKIAQELLEKIEDKLHEKIITFYHAAEKALKNKDYDKAAKNFLKASEVAEELLEKDLSKTFKERARISQNVPSLSKQMEEFQMNARNALRNEKFHESYRYYKKASELAKELMLAEKEEEYRLKSKALQDFYQVDEKFRKAKK